MSSSVSISSLLDDISTYAYNPVKITRTVVTALQEVMDGNITIVDGTNPFVQQLEAGIVCTAAFMEQNAALNRQQYPIAATTMSDLYLHLSDEDYVNMFALPTTAKFKLMFQKSQLLNAMIEDTDTGISQVTIPRNTVFEAASIPFSLQYPIHIRQLQHGGLQAVYDSSVVSPLQTLDTNVVDLEATYDSNGIEYVQLEVDALQFDIISTTEDVSSASGLVTQVSFDDEFYYCRVYTQDTSGSWVEIDVTYTEQVYDTSTATAVLSVANGILTCRIPVAYVNNGLIKGKIRIDLYQTKGPMTAYMANYQLTDFSANWLALDSSEYTDDVAAMSKLTNMLVWSTDTTTGGRSALTFDEIRSRMLASSVGPRNVPITNAQVQAMLTDDGYSVIKNIDTITNRAFWATKSLPSPSDSLSYTPAAAAMLSLTGSLTVLSKGYGITTHDTGMTITSSALFYTSNGKTSPLSTSQYTVLTAKTASNQAEELNGGAYSSTPFYYVYDTTGEEFEVRPYFLDLPSILLRSFIKENATTGLQVSIGSSSISKTSTGFRIAIVTSSSDEYQALADSKVFCQLAFSNDHQSGTAYLVGTQQTRENDEGERTFLFDLTTDYDIDSDHGLILSSFAIDGSSGYPRTDLTQYFYVYFGVTSTMPSTYSSSSIDSSLGTFQLGSGAVGTTSERLKINLGAYLDKLWVSYRSSASEITYQTYAADVPATYSEDVYETDSSTGSIFSVDSAGDLVYTKLHSAGDVKTDSSGNTIYTHRAGDYVLDSETGLPVPVTDYSTILTRVVDIFVIDSVYVFATDTTTTEYLSDIKSSLLTWLTEDLETLNDDALERTTIYFYPRTMKGSVDVKVGNNVQESVEAAQSLTVTYYVTSDTYSNSSLIAAIEKAGIKAIGTYLANNTTVSTSGLIDVLTTAAGSDIVDVVVSGLGGSTSNVVLTLMDSSTRLSIGKVLAVQANTQLAVKDDINVNFLVHDKDTY